MKSLFIGIVVLAFAVFASLPFGLNWWGDTLAFLRGGVPVFALLIGLIAVFIGIADIKDRAEAKKEEAAAEGSEKKE